MDTEEEADLLQQHGGSSLIIRQEPINHFPASVEAASPSLSLQSQHKYMSAVGLLTRGLFAAK